MTNHAYRDLTTAQRLSWTEPYEIRVNGSSPTGVADLVGNMLDGNNDGEPGSDYVAVFLARVCSLHRARRASVRDATPS